MKNYVSLWLFFLLVSTSSFAQQGNLKSKSYYSVDNLGRRMKFNLLDNNKFELVLSYGDYEVTNDSLLFKNKDGDRSVFEVQYIKNAKIKRDKIKVSFEEDSSLYGIYIGAQNGTDSIHYQKVSDLTGYDSNSDFNESFEMNRAQYLYFVQVGFDYERREIFKYEIPNAITELKVKVNYVLPNIAIKGYLDRKKNELSVDVMYNNITVFYSEEPIVETEKSIIPPLERKQVLSWNYRGKEETDTDVASPEESDDLPATDFKLKISTSLTEALQQTKADGNKFLIVYCNPKNAEAKAEFDVLIEKQEHYIGYVLSPYDPQYDRYNFYLTSKEDESWLKKNKMTDSPMLMVLDENGAVLAWANSNLSPNKIDKIMHYDSFNSKLKMTSLKNNFTQIVNDKKSKDAKLVKAFHDVSALGTLEDYDFSEEYGNKDDFKFIKFNLDKNKARQVWKKLIERHQNDTSPDMLLVQAILQEIKNVGYTKGVYLEHKILDEVDFKSIDYLIKHYDAIDAQRVALNDQEDNPIKIGNIITEISNALQNATSVYNDDGSYTKSDENKIKVAYEKILLIDKGDSEFYRNYFNYLADRAEKTNNNTERIKEFEKYFEKYLVNKENLIQNLDKLFENGFDIYSLYFYYDWKQFKKDVANLCNEVSWAVAYSKNQSYIRKAINWSECSLVLNKNNPYYLDTLAQLYYEDGQREKAIEVQTLAVKYLKDEAVEEAVVDEIKETLNKMQNGTY